MKLHFWHFWTFSQFKNWFLAISEIAKNGFWSKKIREINWFDFFGRDFFKFSAPLCIYRFGICCLNVINATSSHHDTRQNIISRNLTYFFKDLNFQRSDLFNISIVLKPEFLDISFFRLDFSEINCQYLHEKCNLTIVSTENLQKLQAKNWKILPSHSR